MCVVVRLTYVRIYINIRVSIRIGPLPHTFEVAIFFFFEVTNKQYDCELRIRYQGNPNTIFQSTAESCTKDWGDERSMYTHHESVSFKYGNFVDLTERTEKFAEVFFFDAVG